MSTATNQASPNTATNFPIDDPFALEVPPKGEGGDYELCPSGNHPGYLVGVIDMGTQKETFNGETKEARKVALVFELSGEMKADGTPFLLGVQMTLSLHEKAKLRLMLEKWRGRAYAEGEKVDLLAAMAKPCLVDVGHKAKADGSKTYHQINGIGALPKGITVPKCTTEVFHYSVASGLEPPEHDWLPRFYGSTVADIVRDSAEWKARHKPSNGSASAAPVGVAGGDDSDCPF